MRGVWRSNQSNFPDCLIYLLALLRKLGNQLNRNYSRCGLPHVVFVVAFEEVALFRLGYDSVAGNLSSHCEH